MSAVPFNPALLPPGLGADATAAKTAPAAPVKGPSFASVLSDHAAPAGAPQFSRHALERLQRRGITVDPPTLARLTEGIQRAAVKGSRDSAVFVNGTAFVVSVKNNTVITAVDQEHMRQQVFTNIDSAVIA